MSPLTALIIDWVLTSFWPIVGREGTLLFTPVLFAQLGLGLGLLSILPWLAKEGRWQRILDPKTRKACFFMGLFGSALPTFIYFNALDYTTPANAAIMAQVEVLYSALLCAWLLRERLAPAQLAGGFLVMAGTGLIMGGDLSTARWKGDLMIVVTPWMYQVSHIYAKRLPDDLDAFTIAGARMFYGTLSLLPLSAFALWHGARWSFGPHAILILLIQGIAMYGLNHVLWYVAIRRMDLAKATTIMLSYPALTVLFSWMLGREAIHATQIVGLLLTLSGATWVSLLVLKAQGAQAVTPAETSPLAPAGG